jgi:hypothetical protein
VAEFTGAVLAIILIEHYAILVPEIITVGALRGAELTAVALAVAGLQLTV